MPRPKFWEETSKKHGTTQPHRVCAAPHNWTDSGSHPEKQTTFLHSGGMPADGGSLAAFGLQQAEIE
jgi:hypothetical protein